MPTQNDDTTFEDDAKSKIGALTFGTLPFAQLGRAAVRAARTGFGLAPAPGEDNDAYAAQYNTD